MRIIDLGPNPSSNSPELAEAVAILKSGGLVAYATETVFGLACDARSPEACQRLAQVKGRGEGHPFPVQVFRAEPPWLEMELPEAARKLFRAFAPGPITVVVPGDVRIAPQARGQDGSVGLRIPDHAVALAVLEAFQGPLACPSANRTGMPPPKTAEEVAQTFLEEVPMVLTGGAPPGGLPSTVVDLTGPIPRLLRVGPITEQEVSRCLGTL